MSLTDNTFQQLFTGYLHGESVTGLTPWLQAPTAQWNRLNVYLNSSMKASTQALTDNFPVTCSFTQETIWKQLTKQYVLEFRPKNAFLVWYGQQFPHWLQHQLPLHQNPWLSDLANVERCWLNCLMAQNQSALTAQQLTQFIEQGAEIESLQLSLTDAAILIDLSYNVWPLWQAQGSPPSEHTQTQQHDITKAEQHSSKNLIWRAPDLSLHYRPLTNAEATFLDILQRGNTHLGVAASAALSIDTQFDVSANFAALLQQGLLRTL